MWRWHQWGYLGGGHRKGDDDLRPYGYHYTITGLEVSPGLT